MASQQQVEFYDNFIEHFKANINNDRNVSFRKWLLKWIQPAEPAPRVLDFGCALGYNTGFLAKQGVFVRGMDISPKCIEEARTMFPEGDWVCEDLLEDAFSSGANFDWVVMSDVIEHIPLEKHPELFRRLAQATRSNGTIIASVPNSDLYQAILDSPTKQPVEEKVLIGELLLNMHQAGFTRVISLFLEGGVYYRMVVQKGV